MTELLFERDAYLAEFTSTVTDRLTVDDHPAVILNQTAFYATAGGQPNDTGTLNGTQVLDVIETPQGIVHVLEHPLQDNTVQGRIDWDKRFDHMQQHTGQHVLSAAFIDLLGAPTVGFHLGENSSTIDVGIPAVSQDQLAAVERLANRVVMEDRAVHISECSREQARERQLRKLPDVEGLVRIVDIQGVDATACCGTHVRATGELGIIHIRSISKRHKDTRIEFLCGWRAIQDYAERDRNLQSQANLLSVSIHDLGPAIERLKETALTAQKNEQQLSRQLLDYKLVELKSQAQVIQGIQVISHVLDDQDAAGMRYAAQQLVQEPDRIILFGVTRPTPQVVFASSADHNFNMGKLLRETLAVFEGRGGGKPGMAQGGGFDANRIDEVIETARMQINTLIQQGR